MLKFYKWLLVLFLFSQSLALAQTTITIGTASTTTSGTQISPVNTYWGSRHMQMVFTKAEINAQGITEGNISQIGWNVATLPSIPLLNYAIKIKHTSAAVAGSSIDNSGTFTTVYTTGSYMPTGTGWNMIVFSSQFEWNGTSNILVDICFGVQATTPSSGTVYYTSTTNGIVSGNSDSQNQCGLSGTTAAVHRPNIKLTFEPPASMSYVSSTTTQNSSVVFPNTTNQQIIGVQVVTSGTLTPISATSFSFNTNGTTNTADILNAKLYYTGTSSTFATTTQFGTTSSSPSGSFDITGSQALSSGTNYFWLVYDVSASPTENNTLDAECTSLTVVDAKTPTVTAPAGSRTIRYPLTGIKSVVPGGLGTYNSVLDAVTDLNLVGVGTGGVTFSVADDNTFSSGPLTITATGTSANPIIFQRSSSGTAAPILDITGTAATGEAGIKIQQGDYITINGLQIRDASNLVDYGIALIGTSTDGAKNNTIKNCVIDLNKTLTTSYGVYLSSVATAESGQNSNNVFYNNRVTDCYTGYYLYGTSSSPDNNNYIGNEAGGSSLIESLGGSSSTSYGVYIAYQTGFKLFNTTIRDLTTTSGINGLYNSLGSSGDIYGNTIYNLTSTSTSSSVYGIYLSAGNSFNIYQNEIYNIRSGYTCYGINTLASGTTINIYKNNIHDIRYTGSGAYSATGLYIAGGTTVNVYNNKVYGIYAPGSTTSPGVRGIGVNGGTTVNMFYNSVAIQDTGTIATHQSSALWIASTSPTTLLMKNNIFSNKSIETTGTRAVAFYKGGTSITNLSTSSNYNLYWAGTPSTKNLIYYDGTNSDQTLTAFKTRMLTRDQNSMTEDVPFVSPYDLHLKNDVRTQVESGGVQITTPIAISDDFDGDLRYGEEGYAGTGLAVDLGVDELDGMGMDLTAPTVSYTALLNNSSTTTLTLANVAITDASGVNTESGTKPRVYYKKSTDDNTFVDNTNATNGWKYVEATNGASPFTFAIDYSKIFGGTVTANTDTIQYFVVAQDYAETPNVAINSGTFAVNPSSVNLTSAQFPLTGTINRYRIIGSISGTLNVGTGQTYVKIGDAITAINNGEITGPVTVVLNDATFTAETLPLTINSNSGSSSVNTITIKPASGLDVTISGSSASSVLKLNGADYVIVDGSNNGTDSRNLTIINTNTVATTAAIQLTSLGTGAGCNAVTIKNCNISTGSNSVTTYGISVGSTIGATGDDNDSLTISNNLITKVNTAVYVKASTTGYLSNVTINNNTIGSDAAASYVTAQGIALAYCNSGTISGNVIKNITSSTTNPFGIILDNGTSNINVIRNLIYGLTYTSTSGYGAKGIDVNTSAASNIVIANNVIYGLSGDGYSSEADAIMGIRIKGTSGGVKVYFNSINLYGSISRSGATTDFSAPVYVCSTATAIEIKNNMLRNSIENTTGVATAYAIYYQGANTVLASSNYNSYSVSGVEGVLGFLTSNKATIEDLRTATGQDANSISSDPLLNGNTNLIPTGTSPLLLAGTPVAGITTDYLLTVRNVTNPSIGAYETAGDFSGPTITFTDIAHTYSTSNITLSNVVITDDAGVNVSAGTKPRIYYKKATNNNAFVGNTSADNGWKWVEATEVVSPFSFVIDYSLLYNNGSVTGGDTVQYFIVATDLNSSPNTSANPSTGFTGTSVSNITSAPSVPKYYKIMQTFAGNYYIGGTGVTPTEGCQYVDLTAAITAITGNAITGPVNFVLTSTYSSTEENSLPITIPNLGTSETNKLTIKPNTGVDAIISGASTTAILKINSTDYVTIDGSNNGSTGRNLTITNTSTGVGIWVASALTTGGAIGTTIKNCNIGGSSSLSGTGISISGSSTAIDSGSNHHNIVIQNDSIYKFYNGIALYGRGDSLYQNTIIRDNYIGSDLTASKIGSYGIVMSGTTGASIFNNTIKGLNTDGSVSVAGIQLKYNNANTLIYNNKILNLRSTSTSGYGCYGININLGLNTDNITIYNNMIGDFGCFGYGPVYTLDNMFGIRIVGGTNIKVYHNSINLTGAYTGDPAISAALLVTSTAATGLDIRNNIFKNSCTGPSGSKSYAIYVPALTGITTINYNDYYVSGAYGVLGYNGTADVANLAAWQTFTSQDAGSISSDPMFHSFTNMHVVPTSPVSNIAPLITGITPDIDGEARNNPTDLGADEFTAAVITSGGSMDSLAVGSLNTIIDPVGNQGGTMINPTSITPSTATITAEFFGSGRTGTTGNLNDSPYYWVLNTDATAFAGTIRFYYDQIPVPGVGNPSNVYIYRRDGAGTSWQRIAVENVTFGSDANGSYFEIANMTGFSEWIFSSNSEPLPVELTSFTSVVKDRNVVLNWETKTEVNSFKYVVERTNKLDKSNMTQNVDWYAIGEVSASGNSNSPKRYSFTDKKLNSGSYNYRLKVVDNDGTYEYSQVLRAEIDLPVSYSISQNYPNPFNPSTRIDYQLPNVASVMVELYSVTGERVAVLVNDMQEAGYYTLDVNAKSINSGLASGVYIYRIIAIDKATGNQFVNVKKMMMLK